MNLYKPLKLVTVDQEDHKESIVIHEYSLYNINVSEMMLSGRYKSVAVEEIPAHRLYTYNGFYIEWVDDKFVAHDLRVNEGMGFSAKDKTELYSMIDNCLHYAALDEDKERTRRTAQLERSKTKS